MSDIDDFNVLAEEVPVEGRGQQAQPTQHGDNDVNDDKQDAEAIAEETTTTESTRTETTTAEKETTTAETVAKLTKAQKQSNWISKLNISHVVFNSDNSQITSIAGLPVNQINANNIKLFARQNQIQIPRNATTKEQIKNAIVSYHKNSHFRNQIGNAIDNNIAKRTKAPSKSTRPASATKDGSLFRAILTIVHPDNRQLVFDTQNKLDRQELDSTKCKSTQWRSLSNFYNSDDEYLNVVADTNNKYAEYNNFIPPDPSDYDKLDSSQFKALVDFINSHYRKARINKTQSGQHSHFENFINGRAWLLFYYDTLVEIGDKDLQSIAYSELDESVFQVSTSSTPLPNPIKQLNKRKPTSRSSSPKNDGGISIQHVLDAKYAAASAFSSSDRWNIDLAKRKRLRELEIDNSELEDKRSAIGDSIQEIKYGLDKKKERIKLKKKKKSMN